MCPFPHKPGFLPEALFEAKTAMENSPASIRRANFLPAPPSPDFPEEKVLPEQIPTPFQFIAEILINDTSGPFHSKQKSHQETLFLKEFVLCRDKF